VSTTDLRQLAGTVESLKIKQPGRLDLYLDPSDLLSAGAATLRDVCSGLLKLKVPNKPAWVKIGVSQPWYSHDGSKRLKLDFGDADLSAKNKEILVGMATAVVAILGAAKLMTSRTPEMLEIRNNPRGFIDMVNAGQFFSGAGEVLTGLLNVTINLAGFVVGTLGTIINTAIHLVSAAFSGVISIFSFACKCKGGIWVILAVAVVAAVAGIAYFTREKAIEFRSFVHDRVKVWYPVSICSIDFVKDQYLAGGEVDLNAYGSPSVEGGVHGPLKSVCAGLEAYLSWYQQKFTKPFALRHDTPLHNTAFYCKEEGSEYDYVAELGNMSAILLEHICYINSLPSTMYDGVVSDLIRRLAYIQYVCAGDMDRWNMVRFTNCATQVSSALGRIGPSGMWCPTITPGFQKY